MIALIRRIVCRLFGHRLEQTPIRRGVLRGTAVGCTRCDTFFGVQTESLPAMLIPRGR